MEHQGDVVCLRRAWQRRRLYRRAGKRELTSRRTVFDFEAENRKLESSRGFLGGWMTGLVEDEGARLEVAQIEFEFIRAIGRIERCRGGARTDRDESGGHFRTVRQHDGDPVIAADAERIEPVDRSLRQCPQA